MKKTGYQMTISRPTTKKTIFSALVLMFVWYVWSEIFLSGTWRYKMTVVVETPEGIKTGSAVREVTVHRAIRLTQEMLPLIQVRGEAVPVDLGKRGILFALTGNDYIADILFEALPPPDAAPLSRRGFQFYSHSRAKAVVQKNKYPTFVFFRNISDPLSVEYVADPSAIDLYRQALPNSPLGTVEDVFGVGVKIKEITIETTDEPMDWKLEKLLPWLTNLKNGVVNQSNFRDTLNIKFNRNEFIAGEK